MPNRSPQISVCLPTFNRAGMLAGSIASVLGQDFGDFELIVSDNASNDETESVVRSFSDDRILYSKNPKNLGPRRNMNLCLARCRGKYIAFLPDDDLMLPENLQRKHEVLEARAEVGLVHSRYHLIDEASHIVRENTNWGHGPERFDDAMEDRRELLANSYNRINLSTVLFRRACYEKLGGFTIGRKGQIGLAFDYEYWMRIALYYNIAFLARPLVKWRIHSGSLTSTNLASDEARKVRQVLAAKSFLLATCSKDMPDPLRREIVCRAHQTALRHLRDLLDAEVGKAPARRFLLDSVRMFPGMFRQREAWKLAAKCILNRRYIDRLKWIAGAGSGRPAGISALKPYASPIPNSGCGRKEER
jgi:hypothetical protein